MVVDCLDQLIRILKAALRFHKFRLSLGRITTQGQNIFDIPSLRIIQKSSNVSARGTDTGKVRHRG